MQQSCDSKITIEAIDGAVSGLSANKGQALLQNSSNATVV